MERLVRDVRTDELDAINVVLTERTPVELRRELLETLEVPDGRRVSTLEWMRTTVTDVSGTGQGKALERVVAAAGVSQPEPARRLAGPRRLHLLPAGGPARSPATARRLRGRRRPMGRSARQADPAAGVAGASRQRLDRAWPEDGPGPASTGSGRGPGRRLQQVAANPAVTVKGGRLKLEALPLPDGYQAVHDAVQAMLPRIDYPELLLEVNGHTGYFEVMPHLSGSEARRPDLDISQAGVLVARSCNVGFVPVVKPGQPALTLSRLLGVEKGYFHHEDIAAASATLVTAQSDISIAVQDWGGGLVASADGLRFVVPVKSLHARPNPVYFGRGKRSRGSTWLAVVNDRVMAGSLVTNQVRAYDLLRMLSADGRLTGLGAAFAHYGRIFKSMHLLHVAHLEDYRRMMGAQLNIGEGRNGLARRVFIGNLGQLRQGYAKGMEDQLGALGLGLNAIIYWNSLYVDAAVKALQADGQLSIGPEIRARLTPLIWEHINFHGSYPFTRPETPGNLRPLRDATAEDDEQV
ncbi:Tn3 family transposase [Nonomuraea jabiensis]|nr:Tn3 family transposase [Nonomuraea jabiensis]